MGNRVTIHSFWLQYPLEIWQIQSHKVWPCSRTNELDDCYWGGGPTLGPLWDNFETTLGQLWANFGPALDHLWANFGTFLGQLWAILGPTLVQRLFLLLIFFLTRQRKHFTWSILFFDLCYVESKKSFWIYRMAKLCSNPLIHRSCLLKSERKTSMLSNLTSKWHRFFECIQSRADPTWRATLLEFTSPMPKSLILEVKSPRDRN